MTCRLTLLLAVTTVLRFHAGMSAQTPGPMSNAERWLGGVKTPAFAAPATWDEWQVKRKEVRATLEKLLGDFPQRPAVPQITVISREDAEGYTLEKFRFENGLGMTVPGYLFLPKNTTGKVPAILYCHWHGGQYDIGKQEMLQTNATPVPAGPAFAKLGYAVLGIDACCFGERNGQGPGGTNEKGSAGEMTASKFCLWAGRTLWGVMVRDDRMALDYLCSRPEVDAERIGVTGISMGSARAWWLMALDERPKAAVCVACMTRYEDLIRHEMLKAHGIYYFVPGMLRHFDSEAVMALAAPRPMLFMTGDQDGGSPVDGVRTLGEKVAPFYKLAGAPAHFENVIFPGVGHVYLPEMWERTVEWMEKQVKQAR
jgi:dipeptidyl aminopeptidase/acylaminoacyl peptidase